MSLQIKIQVEKIVQGLDEVGKEVLQTETLFVSNDLDQFRILLNRINSIR